MYSPPAAPCMPASWPFGRSSRPQSASALRRWHLWEGSDDDIFLGDEIIVVYCYGGFRIGNNHDFSIFQGQSQTMMMKMSLKPVISVFPVAQIAQVINFHYDFSVDRISIFLHRIKKLIRYRTCRPFIF